MFGLAELTAIIASAMEYEQERKLLAGMTPEQRAEYREQQKLSLLRRQTAAIERQAAALERRANRIWPF